MRLDAVYPADDPHGALLTGGDKSVRLSSRPGAASPSRQLPAFKPQRLITPPGGTSGVGRAGMRYRDLIPGRLGGRYIASHITILNGGPVDDWIHYHHVAFQMIFVRSGWVRVVYQDQGAAFVMEAGDIVLQPPGIRHRVLESSAGLEVIEIGCPAVHETLADHQLELPNGKVDCAREFGGQRFVRHIAATGQWTAFHGGEAQESAIATATRGLAEVRIVRLPDGSIEVPAHHGELVFGFVAQGRATLDGLSELDPGCAFIIPPGDPWRLDRASVDFRLLHVTTARLDDAAQSLL